VVANRIFEILPILERPVDWGNVAAICRSADALVSAPTRPAPPRSTHQPQNPDLAAPPLLLSCPPASAPALALRPPKLTPTPGPAAAAGLRRPPHRVRPRRRAVQAVGAHLGRRRKVAGRAAARLHAGVPGAGAGGGVPRSGGGRAGGRGRGGRGGLEPSHGGGAGERAPRCGPRPQPRPCRGCSRPCLRRRACGGGWGGWAGEGWRGDRWQSGVGDEEAGRVRQMLAGGARPPRRGRFEASFCADHGLP
jgi:hypothetical protein